MRIDCDSHFLPKDIFDDVDPRCGPSTRIEELGVPLIVHPSRNGNLLGLERLEKFHLDNAPGFLYEGTLAITSFITGGVLDLFPKLRIGLLEVGCGYLPCLMDRLNEVFDHEGVDRLIKKRPHEYLDQIWITANVSAEKETLGYVVQRYGAERLPRSLIEVRSRGRRASPRSSPSSSLYPLARPSPALRARQPGSLPSLPGSGGSRS